MTYTTEERSEIYYNIRNKVQLLNPPRIELLLDFVTGDKIFEGKTVEIPYQNDIIITEPTPTRGFDAYPFLADRKHTEVFCCLFPKKELRYNSTEPHIPVPDKVGEILLSNRFQYQSVVTFTRSEIQFLTYLLIKEYQRKAIQLKARWEELSQRHEKPKLEQQI